MNSKPATSSPIKDIYPLSPMQEGMLFHYLLGGDDYFEQISYRLKGKLDIVLVEKSFQRLVNRYDVFRTIFRYEKYERPLQIVLNAREGAITYQDIRGEVRELGREAAVERCRLADKERKFKLSEEVPMRISVYRSGEEDYEFIWSFHHILMDGWCLSIIVNEFNTLYKGYRDDLTVQLPAIYPYSSYIRWLEERDKEGALHYWRDYLSGYESLASVPADGSPAAPERFVPALERLVLDKPMTESLKQISSKHGITINTILQGAWAILLSRYNNTTDVVFGSVVSGRPAELPGVEQMVGLFINTIPVRVSYEEQNSIINLLKQVQAKAAEGESHHYHPLSEIQSLSRLGAALLDHILVFENYPIARQIEEGVRDEKDGFTVTDLKIFEQTNYDLTVVISPGEDIGIEFKYNAGRYGSTEIPRLIGHFYQVIHQITTDIDQPVREIDILSAAERQQLLHEFTDTGADYPRDKTLVDLFEEQAGNYPDKTAVVFNGEGLCYAALNERANRLARYLLSTGVVPGSVVGLLLDRSREMIVSILGVLKAGAGYLPIDPALPEQRVRYMLDQSGCGLLLTQGHYLERHSAYLPVADIDSEELYTGDAGNIGVAIAPNDTAYCIFTSGSTGLPKGVLIGHRSVVSLVYGLKDGVYREYAGRNLRVALLASYVFDVSVHQIFPALLQGHSLYICEDEDRKDGKRLIAFLNNNAIDLSDGTPTHLRLLVNALEGKKGIESLSSWILAGEALPKELVQEFYRKNTGIPVRLFNFYGPTETCVLSTGFAIAEETLDRYASIPIGKPMPNERIYITDGYGNPMPIGIAGELCIAGDGLAHRYAGDPALTSQKFPADWIAGENRVYRTGDLAKWLPDGQIEYLGRMDHQAKIRGYRIEPGEIESQLVRHPGIREAVVVARDQEGDKYLVGYYVSDKEIPATTLRNYLSDRLPEYMIPAQFVRLGLFPLTTSGKLDRKALPDPEITITEDYVAPATETEKALAAIWSEILKLSADKIGVHSNFFELGGHSIRAMRLTHKIQEVFSVSLDIRTVFRKNTLSGQASFIEKASLAVRSRIPKAGRKEYYVTSPAQERMYYDHLLDTNSTGRNNTSAVELGEGLDVKRLEAAFQALIKRHAGLRTCFELTAGGVFQKVMPMVGFELKALTIGHDEALIVSLEEFIRPFDLSTAPLLRAAVVSSPGKNYLFIDIHHIICDGTSMNILTRDLRDLYFGKVLPELELDYADFSEWVRNGVENEQIHKTYWLKKLSGNLKRLNLPVLQDAGLVKDNAAAEMTSFIDKGLYKRIKQFTGKADVTDYMFFLSAFFILLNKITGDQDVIIGTDAIGRDSKQLDEIVGTFVNILPLRMTIDGCRPYSAFLNEVKECVLAAFEHQEYPIDQIVSLVRSNASPLIEVHFSFANTFDSKGELEELSFKRIQIEAGPMADHKRAEYQIEFSVSEEQEQYQLSFLYDRSLYDEGTIRFFIDIYLDILRAVISNDTINLDHINTESSISI